MRKQNRLPYDTERLPRHIAIIMDGNGRWAKKRHLPRQAGHKAGISALRRTIETIVELGIPVLTVYAFSTENWKRPAEEVNHLMNLLRENLHSELSDLHENNIELTYWIYGIARWIERGTVRSLPNYGKKHRSYLKYCLELRR